MVHAGGMHEAVRRKQSCIFVFLHAQFAAAAGLRCWCLLTNMHFGEMGKQARAAEDFGDELGEEGGLGGEGDVEALAEREAASERKPAESGLPWAGSDRDYMYEELLGGEGWRSASYLNQTKTTTCS